MSEKKLTGRIAADRIRVPQQRYVEHLAAIDGQAQQRPRRAKRSRHRMHLAVRRCGQSGDRDLLGAVICWRDRRRGRRE